MQIKIEYQKKIHLTNLIGIDTVDQLTHRANLLFAHLPSFFQFKIQNQDGQVLDKFALNRLKIEAKKVKLFISPVRQESIDLMEIQSEDSFVKLDNPSSIKESNSNQTSTKYERNNQGRESMFLKSVQIVEGYQCNIEEFIRQNQDLVKKDNKARIIYSQQQEVEQFNIKKEFEQKQKPSKKQIQPERQMLEKQISQNLKEKQLQKKSFQERLLEEKELQEIIFDNIQCDICSSFPIRGPVFKCLVCLNFDLCQQCQKIYHDFHPTLKMTRPEHYPTQLRVCFPKQASKYMKRHLKQEQEKLTSERREKLIGKKSEGKEVDPKTLKSRQVRGDNFLKVLIG